MPQMPTSDRTDCRHGHGRSHSRCPLFWAAYWSPRRPGCPLSSSNALGLRVTRQLSDLHNSADGPPAPRSIGGRANEHVEVDETWVGGRTRAKAEAFTTVLFACAVEARIEAWNRAGQAKGWRYAGRSAGGRRDRSARSLCKFVDGAVAGTLMSPTIGAVMPVCESEATITAIAECGSRSDRGFLPITHLVFANLRRGWRYTSRVSAKHKLPQ